MSMTGTGEVDHEPTSEEELEKELEKELERDKESEQEREGVNEGEVAPNYKPAHICEELAALGYYARSMKPRKGWLLEREPLLILNNPYIYLNFLFQITTVLKTSSSIFPKVPVCL
jgi:hypothetical protein